MPFGVEFDAPWWLLALPAVAGLAIVARLEWWREARRHRRLRNQEARRLALRLLWTGLIVLALAGISITRPLDRQATLLVLDASASMAAVRDQVEAAARASSAALKPGDESGVIAVADEARVEEAPTDRPVFAHLGATVADQATDLAAGLRLAGALLPQDFSRRVVLISDGRQTRGDAAAAARDLANAGTPVDVLVVGEAAAADVRLEAVDLPRTAYEGEVPTLTARVHADRASPATVRVWRDDGQLALERRVQLTGGQQELALPLPPAAEPGLHRYRVDLSVDDPTADSTPLNNALGAVQSVVGAPRVLVLASQPAQAASLVGALEAGGAEGRLAEPSAAPTDLTGWAAYQTVILSDVPADSLPASSLQLLESYVRDLGRGLVMTGGPSSFGAGGYAGSGIERALPVYMDVRGRGRQPRVALALVIDKSGSMSGAKIEMAKEASIRSLALLGPLDQAAVLAFDTVPQWVAPPTPLSDDGRRQLETAIGSVYADGGTEIYPAVAAAYDALRSVNADVKHLILLTDGRSASEGNYQALLDQMRAEHITLSTVGVGTDADQGLLDVLARAGRGRYHFTADPSAIPEIFTRETLMATRGLLVDARFFPAVASDSVLLRGLSTTPPLDGYIAASPKERAEVILVTPDADPLLAAWQYGAGRAVAWTSDVGGRWSTAWAGQPAASTLWGNVLSWLLPSQTQGPLSVRVEPLATGEASVAVELAQSADGSWNQVRPTRAHIIAPDGSQQDVDLAPAGPGRYRGQMATSQAGAYVVAVSQDLGGEASLRGETGWVAPYAAELRQTGTDRAYLAQVAAAGGGRLLDDPTQAVRPAEHATAARWPAWPLLVILAAMLWPLEIAARRFAAPTPRLRFPARSRPAAPPVPTQAETTTDRLLARKRSRYPGQRDTHA
jgi:Ca-activated chloride channel family protein